MARIIEKAQRAAKKGIKELEARAYTTLGKRSMRAKVATVKRVAKKAAKAALISAAVVAGVVVLREGQKRRALES
jgi:hypothetical protein